MLIPIIVIALIVQAFFMGLVIGLWINRKNEKTQPVAPFHYPPANVDNLGKTVSQTLPATPNDPPAKRTPRSVISKFPDPEKMRKQKDADEVTKYMDDMTKNQRQSSTSGEFAL